MADRATSVAFPRHVVSSAAPPPPIPVLSFLIPVRNDAARLRRCLASIAAQRRPGREIEVIVADNGSTDGTREAALEAGAQVIDLPGLTVAALRNRFVWVARTSM